MPINSKIDITFNGKTMCVAEWSRLTGIRDKLLYKRKKLGWGDEEIISTPLVKGGARPSMRSKLSYNEAYKCWENMRSRCLNPNSTGFENYGGRGIKVCDRWNSFEAFLKDIGPRPSPAHSIDRIDVNGDYSPENTKWSSQKEQARNTRNNVYVDTEKNMTVAEFAETISAQTGLPYMITRKRLDAGWSVEKITKTPHRKMTSYRKDREKRTVVFEGKTISAKEYSRISGIKYATVVSRIKKGWSNERVIQKKEAGQPCQGGQG